MKKKKGGKSKGNKKKKTSEKEQSDLLPEVDKEHFEIQISDLTLKLSRVHNRNTELVGDNTNLRQRYEQLDEDRADIIAHLTRLLDDKTRECDELQDRLEALEKLREQDHRDFQTSNSSLHQDYNVMHTKLQADIKLLKGKLNSLEEFRQAKEELMKKFQNQEEKFRQQEKRHDDQLYDVEKQYMLDRDRLQKELEQRLLQLSSDFQATFQLRIASHTQRVIRENVAVNNELATMMSSWKEVMDENLALKQERTKLQIERSHVEATRDEVQRASMRKQQLMLELKERYMKMKESYAQITRYERLNAQLEDHVKEWKVKHAELETELFHAREKLKTLRQKSQDEDSSLHETQHQLNRLRHIVHQAAVAIKYTVEFTPSEQELEKRKSDRTKLILSLLEIFNTGINTQQQSDEDPHISQTADLGRLSKYKHGSLGIIPPRHDE